MSTEFNPDQFTERELLKLVYRDLHTLKMNFDEYKRDNDFNTKFNELNIKYVQLEAKVMAHEQSHEKLKVQSEKFTKRNLMMASAILTGINVIVNLIFKAIQ